MANTEKIVVQVIVKGQKDLQNLTDKTKNTTKTVGGLNKQFLKMATGALGAAAAAPTPLVKPAKPFEVFLVP